MDVKLSPSLDAPVWAREWIGEVLEGVSPDRRDAARLLVSELVTTSVRDAELGPQDSIVITVELSEDRVRVEVVDPGETFKPSVRRRGRFGWRRRARAAGPIADRWGMRSEGVPTVWFELDLT